MKAFSFKIVSFFPIALLTLLTSVDAFGQIMTFDFAALAGNEASAPSNFNNPNLSAGTITRGAGLTASGNGGRFNATNWSTVSISDAVANNKYMEFTITPSPGCNFSISSIFIQLQRSGTGPSAVALRSSADGFTANLDAIYPIADITTTQSFTFTFSQTAITVGTTYRFYMFAEASGGSGGIGDGAGDDIIVNGSSSCAGGNSITTTTVATPPFLVACATSTTTSGTVDFTSTGTFTAGNVYTAQLSDATGNFTNPLNIGTLASVANSGSIPITIPANSITGSGYIIRVISNNPVITGSNSAAFTITQVDPCPVALPANGLVINEWSNGPVGNEEYYEFVVSGKCGESVDIRGYILDDNNATFTNPADYDITSSGIAPGHFRFTYAAQWASVPVGSVIVVYNAEERNATLPADDPTDANVDSLYVVPHNSVLFERCTSFPTSFSPDSTYTPCTYAISPLNGWGPLSLRNGGDAIQVRQPNGDYYHGVSYGGSEMTGGPHNLKLFTGSGSAMAGWFNNGDIFDVSNWSSGAVAGNQTPGAANNAANFAWLLLMRDTTQATCPIVLLPVELADFGGVNAPEGNLLYWKTLSERNADYFILERSTDGKQWTEITTINAVGNTTEIQHYQAIDLTFSEKVNFYRLIQVDADGTKTKYSRFVTIDNSEKESATLVGIYNLLGQEVDADFKGIQIRLYSDGKTQRIFKN